MGPALGLDLASAVAIGACGVVASAALYAFSGSKTKDEPKSQAINNKTKSSAKPQAAAPAQVKAVTTEVNDDSKQLTKKQRQKLAKQKKREEAAESVIVPQKAASPVVSGTDSDSNVEKPKKKKNKKNKKGKKADAAAVGGDDAAVAPTGNDNDAADDDEELAFVLALAGNQKNMQQMRSDQKLKQQKEQDRDQRRKAALEVQKREEAKEAEKLQEATAAAEAAVAGEPKQETTVIAVKAREVQIILGSGGKVIKQIRAESGARLDVSKRDDDAAKDGNNKDRRLLTIVGTRAQIDAARSQLRGIFKEENAKSQVVTVGDKMAAVIGKGGSVIKRIKEETGAVLDADRDNGTIRVSGEPDQIEAAVVAINKIAAPGDQISMKLSKRQKMLVIGKGGTMIRKIEDMTKCQLDVEKTEDGGGVLKIGGDSTQVLDAMKTIQQLFHEASFTVTVPCGDLIGAIIGKGGEVIRKIQEDTQVKLDIEMDKKSVVIVGYEKDVLRAQERVQGILACPVEVKVGETKLHVDLGGYVSSVIGRGGAKVREIEQASGAVVKVLGTDCIIVGKQAKVEAAKRLVDEILKKQVEQSARTEQAMAAVQALSESHTQRNRANSQGELPWGASAWGNDLVHWTASPVVASR